MFRFLRSRPNPFTLGARVSGTRKPGSQVIHLHRVKIRPAWLKPRNIILAGCVYYLCYEAYTTLIFDTFIDQWDVDEPHLPPQERRRLRRERLEQKRLQREKQDEEDVEPLFIPFPFSMRLVPSPPYKYTDPEWQTFIRMSRDRELLKNIRASLAELVRKSAAANTLVSQRWGRDLELGRYWLDIQYPSRPPPTFVRKGLLFDHDGTYIAEETVEPLIALLEQRALWPSALTLSLWSFSGALLKQNALYFASLFGYESNPAPSPSLQQAIDKVNPRPKKPTAESKTPSPLPPAGAQATGGSSRGSTPPIGKGSAGSSPASRPPSVPSASGVGSPIPVIPEAASDKQKATRDIYGVKAAREHTSGPWMAFKRKFAQTWQPLRSAPPRGSIYVNGLVEVMASDAYLTVDVHSWWDPKTKTFDVKNTGLRIRAIRPRNNGLAG